MRTIIKNSFKKIMQKYYLEIYDEKDDELHVRVTLVNKTSVLLIMYDRRNELFTFLIDKRPKTYFNPLSISSRINVASLLEKRSEKDRLVYFREYKPKYKGNNHRMVIREYLQSAAKYTDKYAGEFLLGDFSAKR
ncbi:MAG: hypothetical protein KAR42_01105 [candidate division Zixibacteria bacterium]|nr:hypothetical protein [candidate division Zixibacteria bacterium]